MSSLNGAITLVQVYNVALVVSQQLDLNVLGFVEESLDEDGAIAKSRLGLRSGTVERVLKIFLLSHNSHTSSTTTKGCLDDDWEAVLVCELLDILELLDWSLCTRDNWDLRLDGKCPGRDFVSKRVDDFWGGADELFEDFG
jgi:hypothetical protein